MTGVQTCALPIFDCRSTAGAGPDDAASFAHGFATVTFLTGDTQTVTSTTAWPR